jgi:hypothetical protein
MHKKTWQVSVVSRPEEVIPAPTGRLSRPGISRQPTTDVKQQTPLWIDNINLD